MEACWGNDNHTSGAPDLEWSGFQPSMAVGLKKLQGAQRFLTMYENQGEYKTWTSVHGLNPSKHRPGPWTPFHGLSTGTPTFNHPI